MGDPFGWQRRQVAQPAHIVERRAQIGRRIGESAVEVEQDRFNHVGTPSGN